MSSSVTWDLSARLRTAFVGEGQSPLAIPPCPSRTLARRGRVPDCGAALRTQLRMVPFQVGFFRLRSLSKSPVSCAHESVQLYCIRR